MKSWNGQEKVSRVSRLGRLSLLTGMLIAFSTPSAFADVNDFKLWKTVNGSQVALLHLDDNSQRKNYAVTSLTSGNQNDFKKFLKGDSTNPAFHSEPLQLMEAVLAAAKKSADEGKFNAFKTSLEKNLTDVTGDEFWGKTSTNESQEATLKQLINTLLTESEETIKNMTAEAMLSKLFSADVKAKLALEDKKADPNQVLATFMENLGKRIQQFMESKPSAPSQTADTGKQTSQAASQEQGGSKLASPFPGAATGPAVGEKSDAEIQAEAQALCDKLKRQQEDSFNSTIQPLKDTIAALVGQIESFSRRPGIEARRNQDGNNGDAGLAALLKGLTSDLAGNNENPVASPQPVIPPPPTTASNRDNREPSPFDANIPEKEQPEQVAPPMDFGAPQAPQAPIVVSGETNVPVDMGRSELQQVRTVKNELKNRSSVADWLTPTTPLMKMGMAVYKLAQEKNRFGAAATLARQKATEITDKLSSLKNEISLNEEAGQRKEETETKIANLQREIEADKAKAPQVQNNPAGQQYLAALVASKTSVLTGLQNTLTALTSRINTVTSETKKRQKQEAEQLAKRAELLNQEASDMEKGAADVDAEYKMAQDVYAQRKDQMASYGQPVFTGGSNLIERINGGGAMSTPRTPSRGAGSIPQSGSLGNGVRNSLGATK